jgi:xanthine dehydrogenase accessory factor
VTVFDDRPELANHEHFPEEVHLRVGNWGELLGVSPGAQPTMGLIVTRGHQHDALVLAEWIGQAFVHLGMIGSGRKARMIRQQFLDERLATPEQLARLACPVGLDIGAQSVEEIAVSIMAQYIQKRAQHHAETTGKSKSFSPQDTTAGAPPRAHQ